MSTIGLASFALGQTSESRPAEGSAVTDSAETSTPHTSHRAQISYDGGLLTVVASNSSLTQILREIARQTGMKITGGVAEDRVFGTYGPSSPSSILGTLLDGTGSNVLLVENGASAPVELVLTPRVGLPSPPNPSAPRADGSDESAEAPVQPSRPIVLPGQFNNSRAASRTGTGGVDTNPAATAPSSTAQQLAFPPINATTPPATATTTPTSADPSPDAVRTPQQIFEQLQRLRQQQQQSPANPP